MDNITFYATLAGKVGVPDNMVIGQDCIHKHGGIYKKTLRLTNQNNICLMCSKRKDQNKETVLNNRANPSLRKAIDVYETAQENKRLRQATTEVWDA